MTKIVEYSLTKPVVEYCDRPQHGNRPIAKNFATKTADDKPTETRERLRQGGQTLRALGHFTLSLEVDEVAAQQIELFVIRNNGMWVAAYCSAEGAIRAMLTRFFAQVDERNRQSLAHRRI